MLILCFYRSEVIAVVRMSGNTAINVAKLQEQLAKNVTIYTTGTETGTGINTGPGTGINTETGFNTNTGTNTGIAIVPGVNTGSVNVPGVNTGNTQSTSTVESNDSVRILFFNLHDVYVNSFIVRSYV